jgi:hypothetical protein
MRQLVAPAFLLIVSTDVFAAARSRSGGGGHYGGGGGIETIILGIVVLVTIGLAGLGFKLLASAFNKRDRERYGSQGGFLIASAVCFGIPIGLIVTIAFLGPIGALLAAAGIVALVVAWMNRKPG